MSAITMPDGTKHVVESWAVMATRPGARRESMNDADLVRATAEVMTLGIHGKNLDVFCLLGGLAVSIRDMLISLPDEPYTEAEAKVIIQEIIESALNLNRMGENS